MTEPSKQPRERGFHWFRGERGERGSTGERGAERGPKGTPGPRGKRGPLASRVLASFVAVVAVSFLVLSAVVWQVQKTHTLAVQTNRLARENHAAIERINVLEAETARFRKERARLTTETDRRICVEVEKVKRVIRAVVVPKRSELLKLTYYQRNPQEIERAIQQGQRVAERFAAINCKNLPTAT